MYEQLAYLVPGASVAAFVAQRAWRRLQLSRAKHPSLAGHSRWSRRFARQVPFYSHDDARFFRADDAPVEVAQTRRDAFERLTARYASRYAASVAQTARLEPGIPDLQFTARYRVPFPFRDRVRASLRHGSVLVATRGNRVVDADGNESWDLTGSYGVNLFGNEFYKRCMAEGAALTSDLGAMLGAYHPSTAYILRRLREVSGHEQASFHMSGTEAVMQAVRVAQYNTGRRRIVRFCGAYHGWWGDVQPGVGNPQPARDTWTLREGDERTLTVLRTRRDIACVLVNPLQALHPNASAPSDSQLIDSSRTAAVDREAYARWLRQLREVCTQRGIVLIFDEVFVGFRLAAGGAQEYFGVRADLVTYGKTLGGGLPVGVVCGPASLMRRYREDRPADICFARGTFNAHPQVMGAMHQFLRYLETDEARDLYRDVDAVWNRRAALLNARLQEAGLPVQIVNLGSIWTVCYTRPSRYNWMLQYYLRAEGLHLPWIGTGRFIFSLDYSDADFSAVADAFAAAAAAMDRDGWWWNDGRLTNKLIRRRALREMAQAWWRPWFGSISSPRSR